MAAKPTNAERLDDLVKEVDLILNQLATLTTQPPTSPISPPHPRPHIKLELPRFNGTYAMWWIFKINLFFITIEHQMKKDLSSLPSTSICFVTVSSPLGSTCYIRLKCNFPQVTMITPASLSLNSHSADL